MDSPVRWLRPCLSTLLLCGLCAEANAQGVQFSATSLPNILRPEGLTEVAGELALTAFNLGTVRAGSTIDVAYSTAVTNNTPSSANNISKANNVSCTSSACPESATLIGVNTVRLAFSADRVFSGGEQIYVSRVRVDASAASGAGTVSANVSAVSADPANNPITFFGNTQGTVGTLQSTLIITPNPGSQPVVNFLSCNFAPGSAFSVRISGHLTSLANETQLSAAAAPTNGTQVQLTLVNIPAGVTLTAPTATVGDFQPTDGGAIPSTGTPITLNYTVATSSGASALATLPFSLSVTGGGSVLPPLGSPATIQATAKVGPITSDTSVIVRFIDNTYGPATVAAISNCRPKPWQITAD